MGRYRTIKVGGKEYEALYTTRAMINIAEMCGGDLALLPEFMQKGSTIEQVITISKLLAELINGAIVARNADIALGLADGEKKKLYSSDYFIDILNPFELSKAANDVMACMAVGTEFEKPKGITFEEVDEDLKEIELEQLKEKN